MNESEKLKDSFSKFLTGWALSMAILDDYVEVISKLEGVEPSDVKNRITKSATEKFDKAKDL